MKLLLYINPDSRVLTTKTWAAAPLFPPIFQSVSRLKYKPDIFDCKLICKTVQEVLEEKNNNYSWDEIMNRRSIDMLNLNSKIYVMWSGGTDSTGILVSILKNWKKADLDRVVVLCNIHSAEEYPEFFNVLVKNIKVQFIETFLEKYTYDGYLVHGDAGGDQIWGSNLTGKLFRSDGTNLMKADFKKSAPSFFNSYMPDGGGEKFLEVYEPIIEESPFPIKTLLDFIWWYSFSQNWQGSMLRLLYVKRSWKDPKRYYDKVFHFYNTDDFQHWSIFNHDKKIKDSWKSFKYPAKEYIVDYTKDSYYLEKEKTPSSQVLWLGNMFNWSIDENWNFLDLKQSLSYLRK
jgi:hypothetical protein